MSPLPSLEVRWFFEGAVPGSVETWFRESPAIGGERGAVDWPRDDAGGLAWRDDRYRVVPGAADLGIKWREGRLQVKGRETTLGTWPFGERAAGLAERWIKWSFAGEAVAARWGAWFDAPDDAVARVEKCRVQRWLALDASGGAREVPADPFPGPLVAAELARIRLGGAGADTHWTLGFEATPGEAVTEAAFAAAVAAFLAPCPVALPRERSRSYPGWLLGVASA